MSLAYDISLIDAPLTDAGAAASVRSLLVRLRHRSGHQGWGECPIDPGADRATVEELLLALKRDILPIMTAGSCDQAGSIARASASLLERLPRNTYGAVCAVETALLDLVCRRQRSSAGEVIGPVRRASLRYAALIADGDDDSIKDQAVALRRQGIRQTVMQVALDPEASLRRLEAVRRILGEEVELTLAVDGAWDPVQAIDQLGAMAPFRLSGVVQPVPGDDLAGMAAVTAAGLAPVIATDPVATTDDVLRLATVGACDAVSLRLSRCGGLINAGQVHRAARESGLGCRLGAEVAEIGLLSAAGRLFASRAEGLRWREASPTPGWMLEPMTEPPMPGDLSQPVEAPTGPGLGLRVLEETVARHTTKRISVS